MVVVMELSKIDYYFGTEFVPRCKQQVVHLRATMVNPHNLAENCKRNVLLFRLASGVLFLIYTVFQNV